MSTTAEFWLDLHRVEVHLQACGESNTDRIEALASELASMPPATREVFLGRLEDVLQSLSKLNACCEQWRADIANPI
jgi:hypothetical protein